MAANENRTESKVFRQIRLAAEADLESFIRLVMPQQVIGSVHSEICRWVTREDRKANQLILLPRDHGKSRYAAFWSAWQITRDPTIRILYISATSNLAEKQLKFIGDILTSKIYRRYWPGMVNADVGKREKWTTKEICVDDPRRKEEAVRDPTVFTGGLTTTLVGLHCDIAVYDDVIVSDNAQTEEGRQKVSTQYSFLTSIQGAEARELVVGTRYHPKDLYQDMIDMEEETFDNEGNITGTRRVYEVFERKVEDMGDGTGEFLWPRQQRADGRWFGFTREILARKKAKYPDQTQFQAQYYNNPNAGAEGNVDRSHFQYYDKKNLTQSAGIWYYAGRRLNIIASVDFAYSTGKRSDYTAICVTGMDSERNLYILDLDRFKTVKISEYFDHIFTLYTKWQFNKLAAETTAAQKAIVEELKESYIKPQGLGIRVIDVKHTRHEGSKEERLAALLEPVYSNMAVWHYRGGNCQVLEDELVLRFPPHDDCKDALASCVENLVPPMRSHARTRSTQGNVVFNTRFGGVQRG